jgi:hypothetical protein
MTMQRLEKRFNKLNLPGKADFDPLLAKQWNDAAARRKFQLDDKQEQGELNEAERAEHAHLAACADAWGLRHYGLEKLDPTITEADRERAWQLKLQPFIRGAPPLTEEEQRELADLQGRLVAENAAIEAVKRRAERVARSRRRGRP